MKKALHLTLFFFAVFVFSTSIFAQRKINITPGFGTIGTVVFGDTTATGDPVDTNTVYILQRGGLYILDGEFSPTTRVNLEASAGNGPRPQIILGVPTGGTTPDQAFRPKANFYAKGLYITAKDEFGGIASRIIRAQENGITISLDDCVLDIAGQAAYRIDTKNTKIILKNSIVSNMGTMASPDNGRVFDDRGNDIDSLIAINNTFYNITSKVIRDGGGVIKYAMFDHNTMVNIGQKGCEIGSANEVVFTNNLIINPAFLGTPNIPVSALTLKIPLDASVTQKAVIRNNNIYTEAALVSAYPDTIKTPTAFDELSLSFINSNGWANTNIEEVLSFQKGPSTPTTTVTTYWKDPTGTQVDLDTVDHANFNFKYSTSSQSYTAGMLNQPIGAVNWFGLTVGVEDNEINNLPVAFSLYQNYPNPFNPETQIQYLLPSQSQVKLTVYNSVGQEITTLVNEFQNAGSHTVRWNGLNNFGQKVSSGIYFYKLQAGDFISTKKMSLLK